MNRNLSLYLDLLRILAALTVVVGHLLSFAPASSLWHLRPLGHEAVIVFFVLSGFVIAYAVEARDRDLASFTISRLARLYSVLLPCLIVTPLIFLWVRHIDPGYFLVQADDQTRAKTIVENAFFLNQAWFENALYFGNAPLWSLSHEFWYYAIFGAAFFLKAWKRAAAVAAGCLIAGPKMLLLMPVWLMGAAAYHLVRRGVPARRGAPIAGASILALFVYFLFRLDLPLGRLSLTIIGSRNLAAFLSARFFVADYALGLMIAAHFIGMAGIAGPIRLNAAAPLIRGLAGFTFSIYVFHFPLLYLGDVLLPPDLPPNWRALAIFTGAVGGACLLGLFTERKKHIYVQALEAIRSRWLTGSKPADEPA